MKARLAILGALVALIATGLATAAAGADTIDGRGAADTIDGGEGDDVISGQNGGDTITGGPGIDNLKGQTGPDTFLCAGNTGPTKPKPPPAKPPPEWRLSSNTAGVAGATGGAGGGDLISYRQTSLAMGDNSDSVRGGDHALSCWVDRDRRVRRDRPDG